MTSYEEDLKEAQALGIPLNSGVYKPRSEAWHEIEINPFELRRRIDAVKRETKQNERERRLWIIALVSAVASVVSALGAWAAAWMH